MHFLACWNLCCLFLTSSDIYFIGGFGTVAWVDVKEYEALQPDKIAVDGGEQNLKVNALYSCLERRGTFDFWLLLMTRMLARCMVFPISPFCSVYC